MNPRKNKGLGQLKKAIIRTQKSFKGKSNADFINVQAFAPDAVRGIQQLIPGTSNYGAIHFLINHENFKLGDDLQERIEDVEQSHGFNGAKTQAEEVLQRYSKIMNVMKQSVVEADPLQKALFTQKLDNI